MTQRERQLLQWIEADPMISQERLAEKAGITRSSVAVHISNLMKKGYIIGKGYVLRSGTYVAVVGGVNVDIFGRSEAPLMPRDSNPGTVTLSLGGVGRNIAHNLALLGVDVRFLTAYGDDLYAQRIAAFCSELGIDLSHALQVPGEATSTCLFLRDSDGEVALALADMRLCDRIRPEYLAAKLSLLNSAQLAVLDTNIPPEALEYLAQHCCRPIFADPVSMAKAIKLKPILGRLHTLSANRMEAEVLSGIPIRSEADMEQAAKKLLATGLQRVFLALGTDGVLAADQKELVKVPCIPGQLRNTAGAGDAFMAALAWSYLENADLKTTALTAAAAASLTMEGEETVNPALSPRTLHERMRQTGRC